MLATTGMYPGPDGLDSYPVPPALPVGVARSLVGSLDPTPDARALGRALESLDPASPDPLSRLRDAPCRSLGPAAAATQALLVNRDPARFDRPLRSASRRSETRRGVALSAAIGCAPLGADRDRHRPAGQVLPARGVARPPALRSRASGITVTSALAHATPRLTPRSARDFSHGSRASSLARVAAASS